MIQRDGKKHEIYIEGNLLSLESSTEYPYGNTTHYLEIVQRKKEREKDELDALRTSFNHINARNQLIPCQKTLEKENKSMTVKIKKQPKEITLEELKQTDEFERVIIYIDEEQKEEVEKKYGVNFNYSDKISMTDTEIYFKKNYINIQKDFDDINVPYDFITKIEVVEK